MTTKNTMSEKFAVNEEMLKKLDKVWVSYLSVRDLSYVLWRPLWYLYFLIDAGKIWGMKVAWRLMISVWELQKFLSRENEKIQLKKRFSETKLEKNS